MKAIINHQPSTIKHAFTLIEMLVVIAIIGILMSLLIPALSGARHRARVTRARMEMNQIETAWISYRNDHRELPQGLTRMDSRAVQYLSGDNDRGIAYMEFSNAQASGGFEDPWETVYWLRLASGNSQNLGTVGVPGVGRVNLQRPVALWSTGSPGETIVSWR